SDSRFFYQSRAHAPAYEDLLAGIRRRESLNVLTGDIGTGKTTLCRTVLQNLDRKTFSAFVPDPFASRKDLLKVLLMDFGVVSVDDLTSGRLKDASRTELSYLLYEFLDTLTPLQAFAVVIIDEAQNLSVPLLEEIRILSDSDGRERQLQVVLVGQLELRDKLKLPEMRQLDQRVSVHCMLSPLGPDVVAGFIEHRLQVAGGSPDRIRFNAEAVEAVYRISGGVPRLINRICDRALHHGYLRRVGTIDRQILEAAVPDPTQFACASGPVAASPIVVVAATPAPPPAPAVPAATAVLAVPAAPAVEAVVQPAPAAPDVIDQWLMGIDEGPIGTGAAINREAPIARSDDPTRPERLIPSPSVAAGTRVLGPKLTPARPERLVPLTTASARGRQATPASRAVPLTKMQKVTRRWTRRLAIATLCAASLPFAAAGGLSLWNFSTGLWELTQPIAAAELPPARPLALAPAIVTPVLPIEELAVSQAPHAPAAAAVSLPPS
ncbi:MAG: AAA family ATPase, partial [Vicinamibacterales bacterium]